MLLRSSDMGRCKARAADMCTITNTFQPQDVGQREAPQKIMWAQKICGRYQLSGEERTEGRIARVEGFVYETSRFLRRSSATSALGHILKGSSDF